MSKKELQEIFYKHVGNTDIQVKFDNESLQLADMCFKMFMKDLASETEKYSSR